MNRLRKQVISFTLVLLICLIFLYFATSYKPQITGVFLGVVVSLYNILFLSKRLSIAEEKAIAANSTKPRGTGMLHRCAMVGLVILLAHKYPLYFDARTIFIGLPCCYLFVFIYHYFEVRQDLS